MAEDSDPLDEPLLDLLRAVVHESTGISDQGYESGRGAVVSLFDRMVAELRRLRVLTAIAYAPDVDLQRSVADALRVAIYTHGPVTADNLDAAVKRILQFLGDLAVEEQKRKQS